MNGVFAAMFADRQRDLPFLQRPNLWYFRSPGRELRPVPFDRAQLRLKVEGNNGS
jgi:hypothetical protein